MKWSINSVNSQLDYVNDSEADTNDGKYSDSSEK